MKSDKVLVRLWREGYVLRIALGAETLSRDVTGKSEEEIERIIDETIALVGSCGKADA